MAIALKDLKLGMEIKTSQLKEIYDTYVLLADTHDVTDAEGFHTIQGKVVFIGSEQNREYMDKFKKYTINNKCPAVFIQRRDELTEGIK